MKPVPLCGHAALSWSGGGCKGRLPGDSLLASGSSSVEPSDPRSQATDSRSTAQPPALRSVAVLLAALEEISRGRPDRVLRLRGHLAVDEQGMPVAGAGGSREPFELLIFRGFSSSVTHPTAFDPDRPALPEGCSVESAELLAGPLDPQREQVLAGPHPPEAFLSAATW